MQPDVNAVLEFLHSLYNEHLSYSSINTARSAISACLMGGVLLNSQFTVSSHPLIIGFMKGIFNLRKPQPKYVETWDVDIVLQYLELCVPLEKLSLKELTLKLTILLALTSGQRCQTLVLLDTDHMKKTDKQFTFVLTDHVKQNRPGNVMSAFCARKFTDEKLCVYSVLEAYLERTKDLRKGSQLLVSYAKPYKPVGNSTVGRWIKMVLDQCGIDTKKFSAHSTRAASTGKAIHSINIDVLLKHVGWTSKSTFAKFYKKPIVTSKEMSFAEAVLK